MHLIEELGTLPGVGPRTAERYAYSLLRRDPGVASRLSGVELKASFDRHWGKNGGWTRASAAGDGSSITTWGKFFSSSDTAQEESFAHETLHLDGDLREQWGNDPAHTDLFNDAAKELLK